MRIVSNVNNGRHCQTKTIIKEKSKVVPPQTKDFFTLTKVLTTNLTLAHALLEDSILYIATQDIFIYHLLKFNG